MCAPLGEIIARYSRASFTAARRFSSAVTFFQTNCWMTLELFVTTISRENGRSLSCAPNASTSGAPSASGPPKSSHVTSDPTPSTSSGSVVVPPSVTITHSASRCGSVWSTCARTTISPISPGASAKSRDDAATSNAGSPSRVNARSSAGTGPSLRAKTLRYASRKTPTLPN